MTRGFALAAALLLASCHAHGTADVTLDADADARNATAARTLDDLAAADQAAQASARMARSQIGAAPAAGDAAPIEINGDAAR